MFSHSLLILAIKSLGIFNGHFELELGIVARGTWGWGWGVGWGGVGWAEGDMHHLDVKQVCGDEG